MAVYTVGQVATLSGVSESTLRAWERRYGLVQPARSPGGYRLYGDGEVHRVRRMAALVASGVPAGRAAQVVSAPMGEPVEAARAAGSLVAAARSMDPRAVADLLDGQPAAKDVAALADAWLLPELSRIGTAWASGEVTVAEEHFVSAAIMRWLALRFEAAGPPDGPTVLVGLPTGAHHEIGLFCLAVALRVRGMDVRYLGPDVPVDAWCLAVGRTGARAVVTAATLRDDAVAAREVVAALRRLSPAPEVYLGGARGRLTGGHFLGHGILAAAELVADQVLAPAVAR